MTRADYLRLVEWLAPRWPEVAAWEAPEHEAMYDDLSPYTLGQIMTACERIWRKGRERAPRAGVIIALLEEMREQPPRAVVAALPPPEDTITLAEYIERFWQGDHAAFWQAVREGRT